MKFIALQVIVILFSSVGIVEGTSVVSMKKGVAVSSQKAQCNDFKVLNNVGWWYDWQMDLSRKYKPYVLDVCTPAIEKYMPEYVPMVWSFYGSTIVNISQEAQYILGFNEPDKTSQANLTPQKAADAWPIIEQNSRDLPLVSPSISGNNLWWVDQFFDNCTNCKIDYLAAHVYQCRWDWAMSYPNNLYTRYGKKIWITEFGCPYASDANEQLTLMQELLPRFEAADYIYRYAWFMARVTSNSGSNFITTTMSLLANDSSILTPLGQFYNDFTPY